MYTRTRSVGNHSGLSHDGSIDNFCTCKKVDRCDSWASGDHCCDRYHRQGVPSSEIIEPVFQYSSFWLGAFHSVQVVQLRIWRCTMLLWLCRWRWRHVQSGACRFLRPQFMSRPRVLMMGTTWNLMITVTQSWQRSRLKTWTVTVIKPFDLSLGALLVSSTQKENYFHGFDFKLIHEFLVQTQIARKYCSCYNIFHPACRLLFFWDFIFIQRCYELNYINAHSGTTQLLPWYHIHTCIAFCYNNIHLHIGEGRWWEGKREEENGRKCFQYHG